MTTLTREELSARAEGVWIVDGPNSGGQWGYALLDGQLVPFHDDFGSSWVGNPVDLDAFVDRNDGRTDPRTQAMIDALKARRAEEP